MKKEKYAFYFIKVKGFSIFCIKGHVFILLTPNLEPKSSGDKMYLIDDVNFGKNIIEIVYLSDI